jgi:methyl-accepting chemotaxis protein
MSKVTNNFAGLNGFVWWTGVVETRIDPLKLGRCQVRIFGWHTDNKQLIPTADLPWALPVLPPNNSDDFGTPREGAYVTGFFADGESGQFPMMLGVLPGIVTTTLTANTSSGFYDPRTPAQVAAAPQVPTGQVQYAQGQPTTAPAARGVFVNTAYQKAYNNLAHNCDITIEASKEIAKLKAYVMGLVTEARLAIEALFAGTESSPVFEQIKQAITYIKEKIKIIQKELQPIADAIKAVKEYIEFAVAMVKYILSLPAYIIALLKDCLSKFISIVNLGNQELSSVINTVTSTVSTVSNLGATASSLANQEITSVVNTLKDATTSVSSEITALTQTASSLSLSSVTAVVKPALA